MSSAKIATSAIPTMIAAGMTGKSPIWSDGRRQLVVRVAVRLPFMASPLVADPGIDHGVEHVDEQVDNYDHGAAQDDGSLDHGEVAEGDAFEEEPAHSWPRKHRLDHHGDVDHDDEVDARQRQHRDEGVLEGVLGDDQGFGQSLQPG